MPLNHQLKEIVMGDKVSYVTKKEFEQYKKYCDKLIKSTVKEFKKWDVKQDKKLLKTKKK